MDYTGHQITCASLSLFAREFSALPEHEQVPFCFILACLLLVIMTRPVSAQKTINVPADVTTIQGAINAASNGDTVLVAPGTYTETIDFKGKNITLTSSGGASATTINGNSNGVVVQFQSGEGRQSVINGFTITGGSAPPNQVINWVAGGINVSNANPTITNNIIANNRGYGINVSAGSAYVAYNTITGTTTEADPTQDYGCDYPDGVGILVGGEVNWSGDPPVVTHNTITQNVGRCYGGGIELWAASSYAEISNNIIASNQSLGYGGGIGVWNGSASLHQNLIYDNVSGEAGGGVYLGGTSSADGAVDTMIFFVTNNTIYGNSIQINPKIFDAWADGSQVALPGGVSAIGFFNNIIVGNDSLAAIACWPTYQYLSGVAPVIVNSDVINGAGAAFGGWCTSPSGSGNISADPKFKDPVHGDFHLQAGSPAIDSGFDAAPGLLATDFDGNARIQNATGASMPNVDMGVYESAGTPESRLASSSFLKVLQTSVFYGQPVNMSAFVADNSSSPITPGTLNFLDNWSVIQPVALDGSGAATASTSTLGLGQHRLLATFEGNTAYQPSVSAPASLMVNGFSTSTALSVSSNPGRYGQQETLSVAVTLGAGNPAGTGTPTGRVYIYDTATVIASVSLNSSGVATYTTTSLSPGTHTIFGVYQPTGGYLTSTSPQVSLGVAALPVASFGVTFLPYSPTTLQPVDVTISMIPSTLNPTPGGTVHLTFGSYSSATAVLNNGIATITVPAGTLPAGSQTIAFQYSGDATFPAATDTRSLIVTPPFAISGTHVAISRGATSGNQSTITVTSLGGFTGTVTLTAALAYIPSGVTSQPTLSLAANTVNVTAATPTTDTLTIVTTAPQGCAIASQTHRTAPWLKYGGFTLACLFFWAAPRRRPWLHRLLALFLLAELFSGMMACGGGGSVGTSCNALSSGTTPATYTVTITGTSGGSTASGSLNVTVQ